MAPSRRRIMLGKLGALMFCIGALLSMGAGAAEVEFNLSSVFNGDGILNRNAGVNDTTQDPVDTTGNVYLTDTAAQSYGAAPGNGLPDNGFFPATVDHPDIQLAYRNSSDGLNAWQTTTIGASINVSPPVIARYNDLHIILSAGGSTCPATVILQYLDGTTFSTGQVTVPNWTDTIAPTAPFYSLFSSLDQVGTGGTGYVDPAPSANQIFGLRITPDSTRVLVSVKIEHGFASARLNVFGIHGTTVSNAAYSHVWTGAAGDGLLTTFGNWQGGLRPIDVAPGTADVLFQSSANPAVNVNTSLNANSITMDSTAVAYTFFSGNGSSLTVQTSLLNAHPTNLQTFAQGMVFTAATNIYAGGGGIRLSGALSGGVPTVRIGGTVTLSGTIGLSSLPNIDSGAMELLNYATLPTLNCSNRLGSLIFNQTSNALTFAGVLSNSGQFVKTGAATLTLTGLNTFTGDLSVNAGVLSVPTVADSANPLGVGNFGEIFINGGTLQFTGTTGLTSRDVNVNTAAGGTIDVQNGASSLTLYSTVTGNAASTLQKTGAGTLVLAGGTDNFNLRLDVQAGTTILSKASSVVGVRSVYFVTNVNAGALVQIGAPNGDQIFSTGGLTNMNGTFDLNGYSETVDVLTGTGTVTSSATGRFSALGIGGSGSTFTFNGLIQNGTGTVGVSKFGTGVATLTNTNTYTGPTTLSNGTLSIAADANIGLAPVSATPGNIVFVGGTLQSTANMTLSSNRGMQFGSPGSPAVLDVAASTTLTYGGIATGLGGLTKFNTTGTLVLRGASTFLGGVTVQNGTLILAGGNDRLPPLSNLTVGLTSNSATVQLGDSGGSISQAIAALAAGASGISNKIVGGSAANSTISVTSGTNPNLAFGGTGIENNLNFVKTGTNPFSSNRNHSYTGSTTIEQGTYTLQAQLATTAIVIGNNGTFSVQGSIPARFTGTPTVTFNGGNLTYTGAGVATSETFGAATFQSGLSVIRINAFSAATTLTFAGTIAPVGSAGVDLITSGSFSSRLFFSGYATDVANVAGASVSQLPAQYNFTGGTGLVAATANITTTNNNGPDWSVAANWTNGVPDGTKTAIIRHDRVVNGSFNAAGMVFEVTGVTITGTGSLSISGPVRLGIARTVTLSLAGGIAAQQIGVDSSSNLVLNCPLSTTGLVKTLPGILVLNGATTLSPGGFIAINGGTLNVGSTAALGNAPAAFQADVLSFNGGTLVTNTLTIALTANHGLTLNGTGTINNDASVSIAAPIAGAGNLVKIGAGTLTLSGASTYSGSTIIQAGTIALSGGNDRLPTSNVVTLGTNSSTGILQLGDAGAAMNQTLSAVRLAAGASSASSVIGAFTSPSVLTLNVQGTENCGATLGGTGNQAQLALIKAGPGQLDLAAFESYAGATTINAGTLSVATGTGRISSDITINSGGTLLIAGGSNGIEDARPVTINAGGTFDLRNTGETIGRLTGAGTLTNNGTGTATLTINEGATTTFSGTIQDGTGVVGITKTGAGIIILSGTLRSHGSITSNAGSIVFDNFTSIDSNVLIVNGGSLAFNQSLVPLTLGSTFQGSTGSIIKNGADTLTLTGFGNCTATFNINAGTVIAGRLSDIPNASNIGYCPLGLGGGTLRYSGTGPSTTARTVNANNASGGTFDLPAGDLTINNTITGNAASTVKKTGTGILTLGGSSSNTALRLDVQAGVAALAKTGLANAVAEISSISAGATVRLAASFPTTDQIANTGSVLNISGTFDINGCSETVDTLSGSGTVTNNGTANATLSVGGNNTTFSFAGLVANGTSTLALTKLGTGTTTLTNSNTFTGGLSIDNGTFALGSLGALNATTPNAVTFVSNSNTRTLQLNGFNLTLPTLSYTGSTGTVTVRNNATTDAQLTVNGAANSIYNGVLADGSTGKLGFIKGGDGVFTISGNNTFTGGVTIDRGELRAANAGAMNTTTPNALTFASNTNTKIFSLNSVSLSLASLAAGPIIGTSVIDSIGGPITLSVLPTSNIDFGGVFDGALSLFKGGTGSLTLSGSNTYFGTVTIDNGELIVNHAGALNSSSPVSLNFGSNTNTKILSLNGFNVSIRDLGTLAVAGTSIVRNNHPTTPATLSLTGFGTTTCGAAFVNGGAAALAVTKTGSSNFTLNNNASSFTGDLTINQGTINAAAANNTLNPVTSVLGNPQTVGRNITVGPAGTLRFTASDVLGNLASVPRVLLNVNEGSVTNDGTINVTAGPVALSGAQLIGAYQITGGLTATGTVESQVFQGGATGSISFTAGSTITVAEISAVTADLQIFTPISNATTGAGQLFKAGPGTLSFVSSNTFTGGVTINEGELLLGDAGALNATTPNAVTFASNTNIKTLTLDGVNLTVPSLITGATLGTTTVRNNNVGNPSVLTINNSADLTFNGVFADGDTGSQPFFVAKSGTGRLNIGGNNTFTGGLVINQGDVYTTSVGALNSTTPAGVTFDGNANTKRLYLNFDTAVSYLQTGTPVGVSSVINNTSSPITLTISAGSFTTFEGNITAPLPANYPILRKSGGGTQFLGGNSDLQQVFIDEGELGLASNTGIGTNVPLTFSSNANYKVFSLNGFSPTIGALTTGATVGFSYIQNNSATDGTLTVNIATNCTFGGDLQDGFGGAPLALTKTGVGTLTLAGTDFFTGPTTIDNGEIRLGGEFALGGTFAIDSGGGTPIVFGSNANTKFLTLNGFDLIAAGLSTGATIGSSTVRNNAATPATFTVANTIDNTFGGLLANGAGGALNVAKSGTGILTLSASGTGTFTGPATVNAGALRVNGTLGGGSAVVVEGGTLTGSGTISRPILVNAGGTLNPFDIATAGTLFTNSSTTIFGTLLIDLNSMGADQLFTGGQSFVINTGSTLAFNSVSPPTEIGYNITLDTNRTGTFTSLSNVPAGYGVRYMSAAVQLVRVPRITSVTSLSADGIYEVGGVINVRVNFSEPVTLAGGNLNVTLDSGAVVSIAPFSNATSASTTYTVAAGQNSADLNSTAVTLAGGATLQNAINVDAILTIPAGQSLKDLKNIIVDTNPPTVASVTSSTADGLYGIGAAINVTVNFSEPVALVGGTLDVTLDTGAVVSIAPFGLASSATGTYTVLAGQTSADLNSTLLTLNGGTLRDVASKNVVLTIPAGQSLKDLKAIIIDGNAPTVTSVTSTTTNGTYGVGATIDVRVNFSKPVTLAGGRLDVALDSGAVVSIAAFGPATTAVGTYTIVAGQNSADLDSTGLTLSTGATLIDAALNNAVLTIPAGQSLKDSKALVIDGNIPSITSVTSTTADGSYGVGAAVNITVNFSEPVTLAGGTLDVTLDTGDVVSIAAFGPSMSASGTYTVSTGDTSSDLALTGLALGAGATLRDAGLNDTPLTVPAGQSLADLKALVIDGNVPTVTSITSSTADGIYRAGATIDVTVNFSKPVTLAGGTLNVALDSGAVVSIAAFGPATSASATYTVMAGENSPDLDSTALSLSAGATLRDAALNDTVRTIPAGQSLANLKALVVDTTAPAITSINSVTLDGTYSAGSVIDVTVAFSEPVTLSGGNLVVNLDTGAAVILAPFSGTSATGSYTVAAGENSADLNSVSAVLANGATFQDAAGNAVNLSIPAGQSLADLHAIQIDTLRPSVTIEQASTQADPVLSGPILFTVTFSEPVTGFNAADVLLGGTAGATTTAISGSGAAYTVTVSGVSQPGTVTATVTADAAVDAAGNSSSASTSADNSVVLAPLAILSGPIANPSTGVVGVPVQFTLAVNADATIAWTFGDGTSGTGSTVTHIFLALGTYTVTVTATNAASGQVVTATLALVVVPSDGPTIDTNGDGILTSMDVDSDGDGFPDEIEIAVGTSPLSAGETPFDNLPQGTIRPINVTSKRITLDLAKDGKDSLVLAGTLLVPAGFVATGKSVIFDIAGQVRSFTLKKNGSGGRGNERFQLKIKRLKVPADQTAPFTLKTKRERLKQRLADNSPLDANGLATQMTVVLMFNKTYYQSVLPLSFQAQKKPTMRVSR